MEFFIIFHIFLSSITKNLKKQQLMKFSYPASSNFTFLIICHFF